MYFCPRAKASMSSANFTQRKGGKKRGGEERQTEIKPPFVKTFTCLPLSSAIFALGGGKERLRLWQQLTSAPPDQSALSDSEESSNSNKGASVSLSVWWSLLKTLQKEEGGGGEQRRQEREAFWQKFTAALAVKRVSVRYNPLFCVYVCCEVCHFRHFLGYPGKN